MKVLYITTIGATMRFFKSFIHELLEHGVQVDIATNQTESTVPDYYEEWGCKVFSISCSRSPVNNGNVKAIKEIRKLVLDNHYDIVHCHTPIAAACARLACRPLRKHGTKVIYTAHGFHFYKGAPLKNWLIYYPVEWLTSWFTDVLITINQEDYARARKRFHAKQIIYVPGVGIDTKRFSEQHNGDKIRNELNINKKQFVLLSVGELNENKNHEIVIRAIAGMDIVYVIVGEGHLKEQLTKSANDIGSHVILTGYRTDVMDFYAAADAYILPSIREGLNVSLMEAMASGLPCLCGNIRGNIDLVDENGGYLFAPDDITSVKAAINHMVQIHDRVEMGKYNRLKIKKFDKKEIIKLLSEIYNW